MRSTKITIGFLTFLSLLIIFPQPIPIPITCYCICSKRTMFNRLFISSSTLYQWFTCPRWIWIIMWWQEEDAEFVEYQPLTLLLLKILNNHYSRRLIKTDGSYQQLVHPYVYWLNINSEFGVTEKGKKHFRIQCRLETKHIVWVWKKPKNWEHES